ncbi:MAG: HAD family phosphatase [Deltaproteobacteria bacterium]|nr:HAD family phosphatase [Deltaproteobacteria bacterium]
MIRAVFWDNDGVLVDTERLYFQATRELLQRADVTLTEELFQQISLREGKSAFDLAEAKGVPPVEVEYLRTERNRRYTELLQGGVPVMDGVREVLGLLQGKVTLAIVTNSHRTHFETMHEATGLLSFFDFILTGDDYALSKPDPEPYRLAMHRSGCRPHECIVVEDSERGLQAALAAGLRCLVVPNGLTRGCTFRGAWRILSSCREIPGEIDRLGGMHGRQQG